MRPQGFGQVGHSLEDLGWNDMGFEPPKPSDAPRDADHDAFGDDVVEHPRAHPTGLTPVGSPVHNQQAEIADRFAADETGEEDIDETADSFTADETGEEDIDETADSFTADEACEDEIDDTADRFAADEIGEEEIDETAEPYEAELEELSVPTPPAPQPILVTAPAPPPRRAPRPRAAPGSKGKAAFTLRLDPDRHLKLRLACAVGGRSAQQLVTDALDQLLGHMPELDAMAAKAKRKG
jgi:hypothetical protein